MPAIIDSAPDCVVQQQVGTEASAGRRTSADFVVGDNYSRTAPGS